jgi:tRNA nucleotidyltransferase (CCA-adding enzyme)
MKHPDIDDNLVRFEKGDLFSETDKYIINLFLKTCTAFAPTPTIVRIVGGYVRDALLGLCSNDIDITVDGVPCYAFAEKLAELAGRGNSLSKIDAHPDQAKPISLARVEVIPGNWIDICNLQAPGYSSEGVATAVTDAQRRDLTINALAFNINTQKVEDWVNGIADLKGGIVMTPIDPAITFSCDPLAVLRTFRFALRFNFSIEPSIFAAAASVQNELGRVTARQRIKMELSKLMAVPNAAPVIQWILDAHVFLAIFDPKGEWNCSRNSWIGRSFIQMRE